LGCGDIKLQPLHFTKKKINQDKWRGRNLNSSTYPYVSPKIK
jgi:hypothetical protein